MPLYDVLIDPNTISLIGLQNSMAHTLGVFLEKLHAHRISSRMSITCNMTRTATGNILHK